MEKLVAKLLSEKQTDGIYARKSEDLLNFIKKANEQQLMGAIKKYTVPTDKDEAQWLSEIGQ